MGHIKEPDGIDFFVDSKPLSDQDRKKISEAIAYFKRTGKKTQPEIILRKTVLIAKTSKGSVEKNAE